MMWIYRVVMKLNRLEFLEKENKLLNNHKGGLIEKVWALESKINHWASKQGELNVFLQQRSAEGWGNNVVDVAMRHIQKLEHENQRLREALENAQSEIIPIRGFERKDIDGITSVCIKIRKVLEGEEWE